ncbi:MAG: hypothetical protein OER82_11625 [Nitrosopumilus sp.]|nr:hypothetical protein [Nitrosopumilus sp.]
MSQKENKVEDNFSILEKNNKRYFAEIENSVPHFQQELFELQNEFYKTWKNIVNTNFAIQREFADKIGINYALPKTSQTIIENINEEFANFCSMRDKAIIATTQTTKKNIKIWNKNTDMFLDWNKSMLQYWTSGFTAKPEK